MKITTYKEKKNKSVIVLVMGDMGMSPRMQNHTLSIVENTNLYVEYIGFEGSDLPEELINDPKINIHKIQQLKFWCHNFLNIFHLFTFIKICNTLIKILWVLFFKLKTNPTIMLVQTPPAHTTFIVANIYFYLKNCKLIIDWHNLGTSLIKMKMPSNILFVKIYYYIEKYLCRYANKHICVTKAFSNYLKNEFGLKNVSVLYDKSHKRLRKLNTNDIHHFIKSLEHKKILSIKNLFNTPYSSINESKQIILNNKRPILIITSTSYTIDEDLSLLLKSIQVLDKINKNNKYLFLITGKGEMKDYYEKEIKKLNLTSCKIITLFLSVKEYAMLLGCCDLGISLHTSSSGLDLPMKIADMFGCGLPVCSIYFDCLNEILIDGINGFIFMNYDELANIINDLFKSFPDIHVLDYISNNISRKRKLEGEWDTDWKKYLADSFNELDY